MPVKSSRAWKLERASVHVTGKARPRSNKYSDGDAGPKPAGERERVWVGGYTKQDGTRIEGHYRDRPAAGRSAGAEGRTAT